MKKATWPSDTLCKQGTFRLLVHGYSTVSEYDIERVLEVPMACLPAMGSVGPAGQFITALAMGGVVALTVVAT